MDRMHSVILLLLARAASPIDLAPLSKLRAVSLARPPESRLIAAKLEDSHVAIWKWKEATMGDGAMQLWANSLCKIDHSSVDKHGERERRREVMMSDSQVYAPEIWNPKATREAMATALAQLTEEDLRFLCK